MPGFFAFPWLVQTVIALMLSGPILYFGRKRAHIHPWELLALVLPFLIWAALILSPLALGRKTLGNIMEPLYFGLAIPLAAFIRVLIGRHIPEWLCALFLQVALCGVAVWVFFSVPPLPE